MEKLRPEDTVTKEIRVKSRKTAEPPQIQWCELPKPCRREELLKNLAVASALVLCTVALRSGAVPTASTMTDAVLAAATGDTLLNDSLGKLSFVSVIFPEATLVFGETATESMALPVSGGTVVHAWSQAEPYVTWQSSRSEVFAACSGTVMGIYHGDGEERLVQIQTDSGLTCMYGCLAQVALQEGDRVETGDLLGTLTAERQCAFEVRRDGISVDPALYLRSAT